MCCTLHLAHFTTFKSYACCRFFLTNVTEIVMNWADSEQANFWGSADAEFNSWSVINDLRSKSLNWFWVSWRQSVAYAQVWGGLMRIVVSSKCNAVTPSCGQVFSWEFYSGTVLNLPTQLPPLTSMSWNITLYNSFHNIRNTARGWGEDYRCYNTGISLKVKLVKGQLVVGLWLITAWFQYFIIWQCLYHYYTKWKCEFLIV